MNKKNLITNIFFLILFSSFASASMYDNVSLNKTRWNPYYLRSGYEQSQNLLGGEGMEQFWDLDWNLNNTNYIYGVTDVTRVWRSNDSGNYWEQVAWNVPVKGGNSIVSDPKNQNIVIYSASKMDPSTLAGDAEGFYITYTAGNNWSRLGGNQNFSRNKQGKNILFDNQTGNSGQSDIVYLGSTKGLWKANLSNASQTLTFLNDTGGFEVYAIQFGSPDHKTLFISTNATTYRYNITNNTLALIGTGLPNNSSYDITMLNYSTALAATIRGIWKTTDGGLTWTNSSSGLDVSVEYRNFGTSPSNTNISYVATNLKGGNLPYFTTNAGATWSLATTINYTNTHLYFGYFYAQPIIVNPLNSSIAIASRSDTLTKTTDTGATWNYFGNGNNGMNAKFIDWINTTAFIICGTDYGCFITRNNGGSFDSLNLTTLGGSKSSGAVDFNGSRIITSTGTWGNQGIVSSDDYGLTWQVRFNQTGDLIRFIKFDSKNLGRVFAENLTSTDGGTTWSACGSPYHVRAFDPFNSTILYGTFDNGSNVIVGKSVNNCSTWTQITPTISSSQIFDLAADPWEQGHLVIAGGTNGLYEYRTSTSTWTQLASGVGLTTGNWNYETVLFDNFTNGTLWTAQHGFQYHGQGVFVRNATSGGVWTNVLSNFGNYTDVYELYQSPFNQSQTFMSGYGIYQFNPGVVNNRQLCVSNCGPIATVSKVFRILGNKVFRVLNRKFYILS